jgi:XTP/dITP diphosphohydrolase
MPPALERLGPPGQDWRLQLCFRGVLFGGMSPLLIATKNAHKTQEFRALLAARFAVTDLTEYPGISAPEETGRTFAENAGIKALSASRKFEGLVLADDSGLCVDALRGAPGIRSARYAGPSASDADNRTHLLSEMAAFPEPHQRRARFQCALVLAKGGQLLGVFQGAVEGGLLGRESGEAGFGYDSLFVPDGYGESFGVLPAEVKNSISHRSRALAAFEQWLLAHPLL